MNLRFQSEGDGNWVSTDGRFRVFNNPQTSYNEWLVGAGDNASEEDKRIADSLSVTRTKREAIERLTERLNLSS